MGLPPDTVNQLQKLEEGMNNVGSINNTIMNKGFQKKQIQKLFIQRATHIRNLK